MASTGQGDANRTEMAYILWDDRGIELMMQNYEPLLWPSFEKLPYFVEKADTFRVAVLRWFGGIVSSESCFANNFSLPDNTFE